MALANTGVRGDKLGDMYHHVPARIVLGAELITEDNAKDFYVKDAAYRAVAANNARKEVR